MVSIKISALAALAAQLVSAHCESFCTPGNVLRAVGLTALGLMGRLDTFPDLIVNGAVSTNWQYVRQTDNYNSQAPVSLTIPASYSVKAELKGVFLLIRSQASRALTSDAMKRAPPLVLRPRPSPQAPPSAFKPMAQSITLGYVLRHETPIVRFPTERVTPLVVFTCSIFPSICLPPAP